VTSDVIVDDVDDSIISGSRIGAAGGKDDHAIDDDGGGGTAIPERRRSRRGRPRRFGVGGDGGGGDDDGRDDDEGDMARTMTTAPDSRHRDRRNYCGSAREEWVRCSASSSPSFYCSIVLYATSGCASGTTGDGAARANCFLFHCEGASGLDVLRGNLIRDHKHDSARRQ